MKHLHDVSTLKIIPEKCTGCGVCILVCPRAVLSLNKNNTIEIQDKDKCMECGACQMNCAFDAISVRTGVGCATAVLSAKIQGIDPQCGCDDKCATNCCG